MLVLFILVLGTGVFLWGMAYKMSLYESSSMHNQIPVAKLSTQASSANKDQVESATTPRSLTAFPLLLDLALFLLGLSLRPWRFLAGPADKLQQFSTSSFPPADFLRPPPFLFHG